MSLERTDEEIINSYKSGNKEVFKELVTRYTPPLYNYSVRFIKQADTPDVLQNVFTKVWKNLHRFDITKSSFKTWLFIIAKNTITDFLRKKKILSFSDLEKDKDDINFSETIQDDAILPDEVLQKFQDSVLLNETINKLPETYKTILVLHYQEEMTFDEIGKVLNKPLNTVKSYHQRAIISLRKML